MSWGETLLRIARGRFVLRLAWIPVSFWSFRFFREHGLILNAWRFVLSFWWASVGPVDRE